MGLAVELLLGGVATVLSPGRRFSLHLLLTFNLLLLLLESFWIFWSFREVQWTFLAFTLVLVSIITAVRDYGELERLTEICDASPPGFSTGASILRIGLFARGGVATVWSVLRWP